MDILLPVFNVSYVHPGVIHPLLISLSTGMEKCATEAQQFARSGNKC